MKDNGSFPVIISAKMNKHVGEILMTYEGMDIYSKFNLLESLGHSNNHKPVSMRQLNKLGY